VDLPLLEAGRDGLLKDPFEADRDDVVRGEREPDRPQRLEDLVLQRPGAQRPAI